MNKLRHSENDMTPDDPEVAAAEKKWHAEELAGKDEMGRYAQENGFQVDTDPGEPDAEDAIARLRSLPPDRAIKQAREWTGRDDISTLEEAIAAVREALPDNGTQ